MELLITFIILNVVNVVLQTFKAIATIKFGKWGAAIVNAVAYGLYTVVIVYTVCDIPLWQKVIIVGISNLIGVYFVKWFEEKRHKDQLWKVEATISKKNDWQTVERLLKKANISHNYIEIDKWIIFNCFCETQEQSKTTKNILDCANAKYFVSETKIL